MILLIDNYDSFSYNLYQLVGGILEKADTDADRELVVIRNGRYTVKQIEAMRPQGIILSPGPGRPEDAGVCIEAVRELGDHIPILGVCLGHQSICRAYGAEVSYAKRLMHGKQSEAAVDVHSTLFKGCPEVLTVGRYHSLAAVEETMPECLRVTARTADGEIMAAEHREYPVCGVQFHPESILTPMGGRMLENWVEYIF